MRWIIRTQRWVCRRNHIVFDSLFDAISPHNLNIDWPIVGLILDTKIATGTPK